MVNNFQKDGYTTETGRPVCLEMCETVAAVTKRI